jgi:D-alanine-D-alanine ligase
VSYFHGEYGEDGCIQGLLELGDYPYTGCPMLATALAMNKILCKAALSAQGIPVLPGQRVIRRDFQRDPVREENL